MKKASALKRRPEAGKGARARSTKPARARRERRVPGPPSGAEPGTEAREAEVHAAAADIVLSTPEPGFAARALPPEPERPLPAARRAIFFDVENTSQPEHIGRVLDHLAVDWKDWRTELIAVGNWKVIGRETARLLARHGAQLVHSAPSVGVSDWSDLRIGVAAGVWLARARPGDIVEIVTNDRAFDAVGDVAASLGIGFRRISDHGLVTAAAGAGRPVPPGAGTAEQRPRRRGRGRHRGWRDIAPSHAPGHAISHPAAPAPARPTTAAAQAPAEAHTAPHDEIIAVVRDLIERSPTRSVTLDALANALKTRGFSRPPGSPRLITRLRRIKEISVSRSGVITLLEETIAPSREPALGEPVPVAPAHPETSLAPDAPLPGLAAPAEQGPRRRRSRRGRRRRHPRSEGAPAV